MAIARRDAMIIAETGASTVSTIDNVNLITFIRGGQANADAKAGVIQLSDLQEVLGFNFVINSDISKLSLDSIIKYQLCNED